MKTILSLTDINFFASSRLMARRLTPTDLPLMQQMNTNPQMMASLGGIRSEAQIQQNLVWNLAQWSNHGYGLWLWFEKGSNQFVGRGGLRHIIVEEKTLIEVAYALLPEYWGQGFATEIALALVEIGFETLRLTQLHSIAAVTNKPSQRVMQKAGFHYAKSFMQQHERQVLYALKAVQYWDKVI